MGMLSRIRFEKELRLDEIQAKVVNASAPDYKSDTYKAIFNLLKNQLLADLNKCFETIGELPPTTQEELLADEKIKGEISALNKPGLSEDEKSERVASILATERLKREKSNLEQVEALLTKVERRMSSFKKAIKLVEAVDALNALPDTSPDKINAEKRVIKCYKDLHYSMLTLPEKALRAYKKFRDIVLRDIPDKLCQIIDRFLRKDTKSSIPMRNVAAGTRTGDKIAAAKAKVQELRAAHADHSNTGPNKQ